MLHSHEKELHMSESGVCALENLGDSPLILQGVEGQLQELQAKWTPERIAALRNHSAELTGDTLGQAKMLNTPTDPNNPIVSLGINYLSGSSCFNHTKDGIGARVESYFRRLGVSPNTYMMPGVDDGITNGHEEMAYSLPSRDILAMLILNTALAMRPDATFKIPSCDKGFPGSMMGVLLVNRPGMVLPAGSAKTGMDPETGRPLGILDPFWADAMYHQSPPKISKEEYDRVIRNSITDGNCNGMYTADTMAAMNETMGLGVEGSGNNIAQTVETDLVALKSIDATLLAIENNILPRSIVTKESLDNCVTVLATLGGSTNAILHLLAIRTKIWNRSCAEHRFG
jgi:dihydroxy-acid dehydratase